MTTARVWEALAQELTRLDPLEVAARSDAVWEEGPSPERALSPVEGPSEGRHPSTGSGWLRLPFFDRAFLIAFPEVTIIEEGRNEEPSSWLKLLLGRYLASTQDLPFSGDWLGFRQLPESAALQGGFASVVVEPLRRRFGHDLEGFQLACRNRGGQPVPDMGDAAYQFRALPRIDMLILLYLGEEGLPSSVNVLFDASAQHHLGAEDLFILGEYLSASLREEPGHYLLK